MNEQMTDGMFTNSNSSNGSNSDDEKCRLSTLDLIYSHDNKEESIVVQQQQILPFQFYESIRNDDDLRMEKTGWLNVKHWMSVSCPEKVGLTSKAQWKRFWIWLKDSSLRLFNDYLDINPKFMINTIDCLCYPLPEQGEYVFSLTTQTGDIYCFQSTNQFELDHWIRCIHTNCLLEINKILLKSHIKQLENDLIYEKKLYKLTELQLKLTTNNKTRLILIKQIEFYEKNLELIQINLFRKQSYFSSLNYQEYLPNSKELLSQISLTTKSFLYNLHAFTPCVLYALIISRQQIKQQIILLNANPQKRIVVSINKTTTTVRELLKRVTDKLDFEINEYFLYFNSTSIHGFIPNLNTKLHTLIYSSIEICRKIIYDIILNNQLNLSGIEINYQYLSKVFVSYVNKESEGERLGVIKGDEIIQINNFLVEDLDSIKFNYYLNQIPIMLTFRSSRITQTNSVQKNTKHISRYSQSILTNKNNEQINKIIFELIQTEKTSIQDMQCLIKQYIEPLLNNNSIIVTSDVIELLYDSVKSIEQLQIEFLDHLQLSLLTENIVISICETFIKYSKDFKIYSTYCSIHLRINRLLNSNEYLKGFLNKCNLSCQHALSFESYLIKPVQRILKYPLFLEQLDLYCHLNESFILKKSIKILNKINKYINSMQQLYEDFGQSFEYFIQNSKDKYNQNFQLNLPELYAYGEIDWINIYRFIPKKNYQYLKTFCFVFRYGCLLLVREQLNKKNQELSSNNHQINKNLPDCFIRFIPIKELQVELINNENNHTWQLIQINPKSQFKTYFRFANKDAQTFIKTINNCISESSNSLSVDAKSLSSSRSCYDFVPNDRSSDRKSERNSSVNYRRSPSPIWKRRPTSFRKRPLSMPNNKNLK